MSLTLAAKVHALKAANEASQRPEHWRVHAGCIRRGFEVGGCIGWLDVPFISTFLLERRREELALAADDVPF